MIAVAMPRRFSLLFAIACAVCLLLGSGLERLQAATYVPVDTVDPIQPRYALGQQVYRDSCGGCHVALPPEVLPIQTWQILLSETQHYGTTLQPLDVPTQRLAANYLRTYTRSLAVGETVPYRLRNSSLFRSLHPQVNVPSTDLVNSCVSCHPGAPQFSYRQLSPEWQSDR
ncbi:cytochrome C [Synechococcus elongatus PCC 11802]|nr:cytochrome C [Synechococcus elongatus PCC 11801]QFZ91760.1 cytochrome C [Synechococcus elongatus PCC 11802]